MDQDYLRDIEASSMSVDDILREFHEQEAGPVTPPTRQRPAQPVKRRDTPSSPPPRTPQKQPVTQPAPRKLTNRIPSFFSRGRAAETEKPMEFDWEKEDRSRSRRDEDEDFLSLVDRLFGSRDVLKEVETSGKESGEETPDVIPSAPAEPIAPAEPEPVPTPVFEAEAVSDEPEAQDGSPEGEEFSIEDIMSEYGRIFSDRLPAQEETEEAAETSFFMPKKAETGPEEKTSAEEFAAYAAGTSAVASSREKISALSSMADEALRYMSSLTDEDFDRMASEPKAAPVSSRKDAGAERFNLGGHQDKMVFGDKELDLSPDENYVPPAQTSAPIYHWTAGEEDLPDIPEEKPSLLQRILNFNGSRREEKKRPLNATARRSRNPYPTAAESPAPKAEDSVGDETQVFDAQAALDEDVPPVNEVTQVFDVASTAPVEPAEKRPAPSADDFRLDFDFDFLDKDAAPAAYAPDRDYAPEEAPAGEDGQSPEVDAASAPEAEPSAESAGEAGEPAGEEKPRLFSRRRKAEEEIPLNENGEFPSFSQYVASLITGTLYRLRGSGAEPGSVTMDTEGEDLGQEVSAAVASKHYGSFVPSLRMRFRIGLALLVVLAWISLGLPVSGMLRTVRVAAGMCLGIQLVIMLLSLDVITNAAVNLARLRFGADSLAVLCCVLTSFDALAVALDAFGSPHMPLCLLSSISLMGVLYASYLSARGLRKSLRVPSIARLCGCVSAETALKGKGITLLKTERPITGFVRRSEEAPPDETAFLRASPILLILCLLLAAVVSTARHVAGDFLYIFTALLTPAAPISALLCFALPFFVGSNRIFYSGAAVAGWSGLSDVGRSQNLIITDRDLFPEGSVEIDTVRIFADADPERILSYAGTMILASGSGIAPCFAELMNRNGGSMRQVENFEFLPGGGMKGVIDGSTVLCGGTELMRLMNVRIPFRLVDKTTVLLAVDNVLYGIFNLKYTGQPQVRRALIGLIRTSRHPVFAVRDFNVNPEMLRDIFDVATDGYDFPPYLERFKISEAPEGSEAPVAAVVCREGLGPLSQMADTGRNMYLATRFNLIVTLIAAMVGVFAVFLRFLNVGSVGVGFLLLFAIVWALPVAAASLFLKI